MLITHEVVKMLTKSGQWSLVAAAVAGLLMGSCSRTPEPDERAFADVAVTYIVDEQLLSGRKVVVLASEEMQMLSRELRNALLNRLEASKVQWTVLNLGGNIGNLPGLWKEIGSYGPLSRVNSTHVLLSVRVVGDGTERELSWMQVCGPLCGRGGVVVLRWDGKRWREVQKWVAVS